MGARGAGRLARLRGDRAREAWRELWSSPGARGCCARSHPLGGRSRARPYGEEFLSFTEQPGTIWGTSSLSESIRLLGFWVMYVGVGFGVTEPFLSSTRTYLFDALAIVGTFLVPLLAYGGVLLTRRWRYAPFLVLLGVGAMLVMFAGFPSGTPFRRVLLFAYERAEPLQFLRTTYKIAPLLALSLACLGGAAAAALLSRARGAGRPVLWAAALALPALFGLRWSLPRRSTSARRTARSRPTGAQRSPTPSARPRATGAWPCCPASCSATTAGATRWTRSALRPSARS